MGSLHMGAPNRGGVGSNSAIFDQHLVLSQKRYNTGTLLLYALYRMAQRCLLYGGRALWNNPITCNCSAAWLRSPTDCLPSLSSEYPPPTDRCLVDSPEGSSHFLSSVDFNDCGLSIYTDAGHIWPHYGHTLYIYRQR